MLYLKNPLAKSALALLLALPLQAQDFLTNGLVAYYPFDGNSNDQTGRGNSAAIIGVDWGFGPDRFGLPDSLYLNTTSTPAANLDGAYGIAPRSAALDFNRDFTWSVWVDISDRVSGSYVHSLISNGTDTNAANLQLISDATTNGMDELHFVCGPASNDIHADVPPVRNAWWQAVVVRSGTNLSLYRNGVLLISSQLSANLLDASAIFFGKYACDTCAATHSLLGALDDIRMYNRALSAQEIGQLYVHEANPLPFLMVTVKTIRLSMYVTPNSTNALFSSTNLTTWTPYGPAFKATNSVMTRDVDLAGVPQFFQIRLQLAGGAPASLTLTNDANQYSGDPERIVAYLNNNGAPIVVGSRTGNWDPQQTWTMSLSALTPGLEYTFELQDPAFGNAVIPPRSNPLVIESGAALTGYIYNTGSGGYFGWYTKWGWGP